MKNEIEKLKKDREASIAAEARYQQSLSEVISDAKEKIKDAFSDLANIYGNLSELEKSIFFKDAELVELLTSVGLKPAEAKAKSSKPEITDAEIIAFIESKGNPTFFVVYRNLKGKITRGDLISRLDQLKLQGKITISSAKNKKSEILQVVKVV